MEIIKKHKKSILLFSITLLVSLLMCFAFLQPHYSHDTYYILRQGLTDYATERFLQDARPFTAFFTILADKLSISVEVYSILSFLLGLVFLSIAVVLIYQLWEKEGIGQRKETKIMLFLVSFLMVFHYLAIEYIYFLETYMLALGILLSVLAARVMIQKEKYATCKAMLLILIAAFCYQGSIAIFPMLLLTYYVLFRREDGKGATIDTIKAALIYGIAMLLTILFSNVLFQNTRIQMGNTEFHLASIGDALYQLMVQSLSIFPPYVHIAVLLITSIIICLHKKDKLKLLLGYWLIILAAVIICLMPILTGSGIWLEARTSFAYGMTIGISLLFILYTVQDRNRFLKIISYVLIVILFIANVIMYLLITNQHILVNQLDKANCQIIKQVVEEYEEENKVEITKIAAIIKGTGSEYYPGCIKAGDMTQSALNTWPVREVICFYLGRWLEYAPITTEQFLEFFGDKTWNSFSKDQIYIEGNILYFCGN